jgi:hypothetical protein
MKKDRENYSYNTSTKAIQFSPLYDGNSPVRDEESREGRQFRLNYGVPWKVFETLVKTFDQRFNPHASLRKLKDVLFELRIMKCLMQLCLGGPLGQHLSTYSPDYSSFCKLFLEKSCLDMGDA